jgi:UDP-glucuronate decarboxylase
MVVQPVSTALCHTLPLLGKVTPKAKAKQLAIVAGGGGFLGSHFVDALLTLGYHVWVVDSWHSGQSANLDWAIEQHDKRLWIFTQDISQVDTLLLLQKELAESKLKLALVAHLASVASPPRYQQRPLHTLISNINGTQFLTKLAAQHGCTFLLASTSEVYGDPHQHPQPETYWGNVNPVGARSCYDEGKRTAETLAYLAAHSPAELPYQAGFAVRIARIFNTFGPRMHPADGRVVSNLLRQAVAGQPLTVYGTGQQTRSLCYVSDLIDGLLRLALLPALAVPEHRPWLAPVNLGNDSPITMLALAHAVAELCPTAGAIEFKPLPADDPQQRCPDLTRAKKLLGYAPTTPWQQGLADTLAYWQAELSKPNLNSACRPTP